MSKKIAFAVVAHPDDIEFMMAGTLVLLGRAGYELHYMNLANGSAGSSVMDAEETARVRTVEAREAAEVLGAAYHEPLTDDLTIFYTPELCARLGAVVREIDPTIVLVPSLNDYMEDHMITARLGVTASFTRNISNYPTDPPTDAVFTESALYHAQPAGLRDPVTRQIVNPDVFVDITSVMETKTQALGCHRSQKEWLDKSQGMDSYIKTMDELATEMGKLSGCFKFAEGWRRHLHLGFSGNPDFDPLTEALKPYTHQIFTSGDEL
jgi:N-acetylglucosamine malate deacetylase 1